MNAQSTIQAAGVEYTFYEQQWYTSQTINNEIYLFKDGKWQYLSEDQNKLYEVIGDEIAVTYKKGTSRNEIIALENAAGITNSYISPYSVYYYSINTVEEIFSSYETVSGNPIIKNASISKYGKWMSLPNDAELGKQWHLHHANSAIASIKADSAWDIATGNSSVIVAVIDSEIDWAHDDLGMGSDGYQNIYLNPNEDAWSNPLDPTTGNGIDDDGNGVADDWKGANFAVSNGSLIYGNNEVKDFFTTGAGHGTAVAGIIAAKRNNTIGVSGIAGGNNGSGVKILAIRAGTAVGPSAKAVAKGIDHAVAMGASIIQLSATIDISDAFRIAPSIENAYNNGVIIIGAAGTESPSNIQGEIVYPASHPMVFAVAGTDSLGQLSQFSEYGAKLNLAAPGEAIYTTRLNNGYGYYTGSSFATPVVSGVAALMKSANPCISADMIQVILETTSSKFNTYDYNWRCSTKGHSRELGYGMVNAYEAVKKAAELVSSGVDLYIKDNRNDLGIEPNSGTYGNVPPDIIIRNDNDSIFEKSINALSYENNVDSIQFIYVKVRNRGCSPSLGTEQLKLYWGMIGTTLHWPNDYNGTNTYPNTSEPVGGLVDSVTIPVILPGKFAIIEVPWIMPDMNKYPTIVNGANFASILARIDAVNDTMTLPESNNTYINSKANNNIALTLSKFYNFSVQRPITEIHHIGTPTLVGNITNTSKTYNIQFNSNGSIPLSDVAEIEVVLSDEIWQAWQNGGMQQQGIEIKSSTNQVIKLLSSQSTLNNISLTPNERGLVTINPYFLTDVVHQRKEYGISIDQQDNGSQEVVGSFTHYFIIDDRELFNANAGNDEVIHQNETIELNAVNIGEDAIYNWYNQNGDLIYEGQNLYITPEVTTEYELEVIALADGFKDYDEVIVNVLPHRINSLYPNPPDNQLTVGYEAQEATSAYLLITSPYTNSVNNYIINTQDSSHTIDVSAFPPGLYSIVLICDGELADQKVLLIQ